MTKIEIDPRFSKPMVGLLPLTKRKLEMRILAPLIPSSLTHEVMRSVHVYLMMYELLFNI